jgi:membrane fusion protein, copper/silver efflux system
MGYRVVLAYSGGLDTTIIVPWLRERYGAEVICMAADVGQGEELMGLERRAREQGASGFVVEKPVQAGQAVQAGEVLYRLADLSRVWVEADVYESDIRLVRLGEAVDIEIAAYPGESFTGRVAYIYPDVRPDTRTGRVRLELPNPGGRIKPGMFATVHVAAPVAERGVVVPRDAVMRTGVRDLVFVEIEPGAYELREVRVGADAEGRTQILAGLLAGERVVARANFILDAESRLMEAMMGQPGMPGMDMDMPGMDMDMDMPGMDMPGMEN